MRCLLIEFSALAAVFPAVGQQLNSAPPNRGIVNEQVLRNAVHDALQKAVSAPGLAPEYNLPSFQVPATVFKVTTTARVVHLPPVRCAVPLTEVPVRSDLDQGILRPEIAVSRDAKMPIATGIPSCADIKNR